MAAASDLVVKLRLDTSDVQFETIRPGDKVLLTTERNLSNADADRVTTLLHRHFPDVEFVVAGGFKAIVQRADNGHPDGGGPS